MDCTRHEGYSQRGARPHKKEKLMSLVYKQLAAKLDIIDHFEYLAEHAELAVAERFLASADASFTTLALNPLIGSPLTLQNPELSGMRKWRVKNFDNVLIFYMPLPDGVSIVRVLHAAEDWWDLLGFNNS
jgi:toxin ParE1/3/4